MRLLRVAVPGILLLSLAACAGLPQGPSTNTTGSNGAGLIQKLPEELVSNNSNSLTMTLSNGAGYSTAAAPVAPEVQHVYVTFDQVRVHYDATASVDTPPATESADADAGWISFPASASVPIDLVGLSADTLFGASSSLQVGTYTQIRLPVTSAEIVFSDQSTESLDIASGNLKIIKPFAIKPGTKTTLHFDFDTAHSLQSANGQWKLRPTAIKTVATYEALPAATSSATATSSTGS